MVPPTVAASLSLLRCAEVGTGDVELDEPAAVLLEPLPALADLCELVLLGSEPPV